MPHCILEYTDNIKDKPSWNQVFKELHKILVDTGEWIESDIKSRAIKHSEFYIGDGNPNQAFVTLNLQILNGRSDELKESVSKDALEILCNHFKSTIKSLQTSITVQISDIHTPSYSRKMSYSS
ncbi:MAG: 5-carboxymethyl-2-hydroxymuconate Delta-isomerase [Desulfobacterales bacterium]|nr:5-carboxymethyl-2-hydroxymuconate Delta-isomerase [Desulfobacterales bacterium]